MLLLRNRQPSRGGRALLMVLRGLPTLADNTWDRYGESKIVMWEELEGFLKRQSRSPVEGYTKCLIAAGIGGFFTSYELTF
jgi:hypothetical protein